MAAFSASLFVWKSPSCKVAIRLRRDTEDAAILFAQKWLLKSRLSTRYLGRSFDGWQIEEVIKGEPPRFVAMGNVPDSELAIAARGTRGRRRNDDGEMRNELPVDPKPRKARIPVGSKASARGRSAQAARDRGEANGTTSGTRTGGATTPAGMAGIHTQTGGGRDTGYAGRLAVMVEIARAKRHRSD